MSALVNGLNDLRAALAFLTILPVGYPTGRQPGYAYGWFPLVGLLVGLALAGVASLPWPTPATRGFCLLLVWVVLTGGLHLDGFGDSCDGLLATTTPERRLEIMKDPRTGSWAVVGLILLLLGKWVFLQTAPAGALLIIPVIARWAMVLAAVRFAYARSGGLGGYFRQGVGAPQERLATLWTLLIGGVLLWWLGGRLLLLGLTPLLTVGLGGRWAAARLNGGLTGDSYGAICEASELISLGILVMVL